MNDENYELTGRFCLYRRGGGENLYIGLPISYRGGTQLDVIFLDVNLESLENHHREEERAWRFTVDTNVRAGTLVPIDTSVMRGRNLTRGFLEPLAKLIREQVPENEIGVPKTSLLRRQ